MSETVTRVQARIAEHRNTEVGKSGAMVRDRVYDSELLNLIGLPPISRFATWE